MRSVGSEQLWFVGNVWEGLRRMLEDRMTAAYFVFLVFIVSLAVLGPVIAPYEPEERLYTDDGDIMQTAGPSAEHLLGTTDVGYDVFSRLLYGARPTVLAGVLGGTMIVTIGTVIGLTAGYVGGRVEAVLMRFTDLVYGIPLIPFAIVLISFTGVGFFKSVVVIGLVLWRGTARVIRAQTLQVKERPFIQAAEATGAGSLYVITKHILPNVAPMAVLFFATTTGFTIVLQAGLAFLGVTDPFVPSWGVMIRNAYESGRMTDALWWSLPPGLLIGLTVLSLFMFGRGYERLAGSDDDAALAQAG